MLVKKLSWLLAFGFVLFLNNPIYAGLKLDNWKTFTSLVDAKDATLDENNLLWVGTSGGVFTYNFETKEIVEYRNTEGLLSLKVSSINYNPNDKSIYIGTSDGYLHILTNDKKWHYLTDIVIAKYPNPEIKKIIFEGDYALISGGFGVAKFDTKRRVFIETVSRFGSMQTNPSLNDIEIIDNNIWIATNEGVAYIDKKKQISNPKDWNLLTTENGLPDNDVKFITQHENLIFVSTNNAISQFDGTFTTVQTTSENEEIKALFLLNGKLIYSNNYEIFDLKNQSIGFKSYWHKTNAIKVFNINDKEIPVLLYSDYAFSYIMNNENIHVMPNTPISNNFMDMEVDSKGRLWIATRSKDQNNGRGFIMFDGKEKWNNITPVINEVTIDQCLKINITNKNDVYISTWGSGLLKASDNDTGMVLQLYDTTNSPLTGAISSSRDYVIIGDVQEDNSGKLWAINYGEGNPGPILISLEDEDTFKTYNNLTALTDRQFLDMAIDQWGIKWLASSKFGKGLYYFYENRTPDDPSDDIYGKLTQSNSSILDNDQTALAVDKTGILWIGTSSGLNYIYDTYSAISGNDIYVREETQFLRSQYIYDIHVDALNNKWIATNKGIWVLNEDASETFNLEILNSTNSPLIDDEVLSITSDPATGLIYFGTKNGLSVAQSTSVLATDKYDIKCYPQPFNPIIDAELFIDGLEENSDVIIMANDGTYIQSLTAKGRIVSWDGKDFVGNIVESGVYIVVGSSITTKGGAVGKFAVLKK